MNLIAAVDKNWAIGNKNQLLVRIPAGQKFFRETTTGKVVVMGRKTLESFPNGLPLKNRTNIVLTHDADYRVGGAIVVHPMADSFWTSAMWRISRRLILLTTRMRISRIWTRETIGR